MSFKGNKEAMDIDPENFFILKIFPITQSFKLTEKGTYS